MSRTKDYYEKRAEELGLDIELTDETVDKIAEADQRRDLNIDSNVI